MDLCKYNHREGVCQVWMSVGGEAARFKSWNMLSNQHLTVSASLSADSRVDEGGDMPGAETVVDIDDRDAR